MKDGLLRITALLLMFMLVVLGYGAGCSEPAVDTDSGPAHEKLAYLHMTGETGNLMLTTTAGGEGESLLQWKGLGERFSFSNDGRYFTIYLWDKVLVPGQELPVNRYFVASTDGRSVYHMPARIQEVTFSPDSTRVAYLTKPDSGPNEVKVMDFATKVEKTLVSGAGLTNPTWVDDRTLVYTEMDDPAPLTSWDDDGVIFRVDTVSGEITRLTDGTRLFSTYCMPVSYTRSKLVVEERGELNNLWSLDLTSGRLLQVTNNDRYHFRGGYLGTSDRIIFQQLPSREDAAATELCTIGGDGSDFTMLTSNFYFDGLQSFSLESGRIAFQRTTDKGVSSIWTIEEDGSGASMVTEADYGWVGDPNFAPVAGWKSDNPLRMEVIDGTAGEPFMVKVSNPTGESVDAVLRAFPAIELTVTPDLIWNIKLGPGETREIEMTATVIPTVVKPTETSLVISLAVEGTPPRMYRQLFE